VSRKATERRLPRLDDDVVADGVTFTDEADITGAVIRGDFVGSEFHLVALRQCRVEGATFTGSQLIRATFVDCLIVDSDLSGALLEDCRFERVELRRCRLSGVQAPKSQFTDVALIDCKADAASFRMTVWERAEFRDSNLVESDFYSAKLSGSQVFGCDLGKADLSKSDLTGTRMQRSNLNDVRGGESLRGVTISSDQIIPAALAVFKSMKIRIDDD
jgi:uncharacterized protein YjbI with pentapeptide repeats